MALGVTVLACLGFMLLVFLWLDVRTLRDRVREIERRPWR